MGTIEQDNGDTPPLEARENAVSSKSKKFAIKRLKLNKRQLGVLLVSIIVVASTAVLVLGKKDDPESDFGKQNDVSANEPPKDGSITSKEDLQETLEQLKSVELGDEPSLKKLDEYKD